MSDHSSSEYESGDTASTPPSIHIMSDAGAVGDCGANAIEARPEGAVVGAVPVVSTDCHCT